MARRTRGRNVDSLIPLAIIIVILLYGVYAFSHHDLLTIALYTSVGLAIPTWFFAMQVPNRCGMATVRDGHPCRLRSYGVIFGCWQYHFTMKAKARFGNREQAWEEPPARDRRRKLRETGLREPLGTTGKPVQVEIVENAKSRLIFWCTMVTTFLAVMTWLTSLFVSG
ncbi:MAG: hypothetical protein ACREP9_00340 [Candidatus Dormibacteraceae bacterium]